MTPLPANPLDERARAVIERQLSLLGELAEVGLEIARCVERQAKGGSEPQADPALAYARVARAVRLTVMLQSKVLEALQALDEDVAAAEREGDFERREERKFRAEAIVKRAAKARGHDQETVERLLHEAGERLDADDIYGDLLAMPLSALVARLCRDLNLDPDWTALAEEAWAQEEISRDEWTIRTRPPPLAGEGDPKGGGGIQPPPTLDRTCAPKTSPSNAPDG